MFGNSDIKELIEAMNSNNEKLIQSINLLTEAMQKKKPKTKKQVEAGEKTVNWQNCPRPTQQIMKFWVFNYLPESYRGYTAKEYSTFIGRHGKNITGILNTCRGDVNMACKVILMVGARLGGKGLDWSLNAVEKHASDYVEEIRRIQNAHTK